MAPSWLRGAHAQTIWPLLRKGSLPNYRRERWATPDHDFIDIDWIDGPARGDSLPPISLYGEGGDTGSLRSIALDGSSWGGPATNAPLVVLFHGLEGSSRSHYARRMMHAVAARGWRGGVVHFRGCSGEANLLPRAYHSGDSAEIDWTLRRFKQLCPEVPLYAVGFSLGGNALLKWLGEQGEAASAVVDGAAAICPPLDLAAANESLSHGFNLVYARHFLNTLIPKAIAKLGRFPGIYSAGQVRRSRTLYDFDDIVTAPLHGFRGANDYYARCSAKQFLRSIGVPTLLINTLNDPFLPLAVLPRRQEISPRVCFETHGQGGHVGFVAGRFPGQLDWMPQRVLAYFSELP